MNLPVVPLVNTGEKTGLEKFLVEEKRTLRYHAVAAI